MPSGFTGRVPVLNADGRAIGVVAWDILGDVAEIADGMVLPAELQLRFYGSADQPSLLVKYGIRDGAPVCVGVTIESKDQGRDVLPKDFEIIRRELANWSEAVITSVIQHARDDQDDMLKAPDFVGSANGAAAFRASQRGRRRKVDDRLLEEVAALYREFLDDRPWRVIADRFNVSETTAARYVVKARKAGLLPATEPGKKKA